MKTCPVGLRDPTDASYAERRRRSDVYGPPPSHNHSSICFSFVGQPESREVLEHDVVLVVVPETLLVLHPVRALRFLQRALLLLLLGQRGRIVRRCRANDIVIRPPSFIVIVIIYPGSGASA